MPATASAACTAGGSEAEVFVIGANPYRLTCNDGSDGTNKGFVWGNTTTNNVTGESGPSPDIYYCTDEFVNSCGTPAANVLNTNDSLMNDTTYRFKTGNGDYFKGDWSTTGWQNPALYTPTPTTPTPTPTPIAVPIDSPFWSLLTFLGLGFFMAWQLKKRAAVVIK